MISVTDIYNATREGLDVIFHYYPQAQGLENKKNAKFKVRPNENTASASLYHVVGKDYSVWKVVDFGGDGHAMSPIDICMREEGFDRVNEAILFLAGLFGVKNELNKSVNKPDVRKRPANSDEKDGSTIFSLLPEIPENHLKVLGPKVTKENAEDLHWYEAEFVGHVKNREVTLRYSNEHYPIFLRECIVEEAHGDTPEVKFYKIYEPLNPEKGFRFSYTPQGVKPKIYINGFAELKAQYRTYNNQLQADFYKDPANEDKPFKEQKMDEAFICSGERDALCCKSMGYTPIWFNSETYNISDEEYREIMKYVKVLYNIPDIDDTGIRRGTQLALERINIYTIWLPEWLKTYRDNRGKPRKDLRDWMEIRDRKSDFRNLIEIAMPAKFWVERVNKKTGITSYDIDSACLHYFLGLNGFHTLHDENLNSAKFIRIKGNIVSSIQSRDVRKFLREWANEHFLNRDIRNLILNSPRVADSALENLYEIDLDFTSYTPFTQLFFFPSSVVEITPEDIIEHNSGSSIGHYVWEENIIKHKFRKLPPMFDITRHPSCNGGQDDFDIKINNVPSSVMGYLINSSRIYWRKELEENFADKSSEEAEAYRESHKFCIDGEGLTAEEIKVQKQNFVNKIFTIGYMLHRYKSPSRGWAPIAMDNKIGEDGECNGRSGKSFLFMAVLKNFMKTVKLSGRNPRLMDNPHVFDQVTKHTDFLFIDDCSRYFPIDQFYDIITSDLTVNPKNNQSYTIDFIDAPKIGFSTNYVPSDFSASTTARLLFMVFSDYYHELSETNDYMESRSIRDDFGGDLFGASYTEEQWNADINFCFQCAQFYLSLCHETIKILPPMSNIILRKYKSDMASSFEDWASVYFAEDGPNVDEFVVRRQALEDYTDYSKQPRMTMNKFTTSLKAFAVLCPYIAEYNPADLTNSQHRITRRVDDKVEDMIYLRTYKHLENQEKLNDDDFAPDEHSAREFSEDAPPF